jgi:hypothetical protein
MSVDKKISYEKPVVQGGVDNYLGKQPQVQAPRKWQSAPDKPATELAYITEAEKDLILKANIHGGLERGPNMGPSGIMSLDSFGDAGGGGASGGDTDAGGGASEGPGTGGGGFSGRSVAEINANDRDKAFNERVANEKAALQIAERTQAKNLGIQERENIADATYGPLQKYTGKSSLFGGANKYGYTDTLPDGSLKPGYGGRIMGGLLGLATGIPFIGGAIGSAYDKGKGFFSKQPKDMSEYNKLGLYTDRFSNKNFTPTQQGDYDIYGNKINEITGEVTSPTGESLGTIPGYPGGSDDSGGITTIPQGGSDEYVRLIEEFLPPSTMPEDEDLLGGFKSRFLQNRPKEEREAIEKMINEKFKYDYNSFGLGDMDGS